MDGAHGSQIAAAPVPAILPRGRRRTAAARRFVTAPACYPRRPPLPHAASVPESEIAIVRARHGQLPDVARLAGIIWRAHYPGILTHEQIDYMLERGYALDKLAGFLDGPGRGLEVVTVDDALAGFAAWYVTVDPAEAKLDKLYVLQSRQRRGLGGRLIECVEGHARAGGARTLVLNVNKSNDQAVRAYAKHGFAIREAVVVDIGGGFVMDDYVMAKPL